MCGNVYHLNVADLHRVYALLPGCSHVITSPPYINAQDYFRNSKLELYLLEGLLPFQVDDIIRRFIGTERGVKPSLSCDPRVLHRRHLIPELSYLETHHPRQASVIHRYIRDMETAFRSIKSLLKPRGTFVLVCGDNLVGNRLVVTWKALSDILESLGFSLVDRFEDRIRNRALAPGRRGPSGVDKARSSVSVPFVDASAAHDFGYSRWMIIEGGYAFWSAGIGQRQPLKRALPN